ncbi:MAG: PorT family protein [Saprospiraceae bacterium]|nr:PorT family protein [Saprospiraceae bacterium]
MKSLILSLVAIFFCFVTVNAQKIECADFDNQKTSEISKWSVGVFVHPNYSIIDYSDYNKPQFNFSPGLLVGRQFGEKLTFQTGITYLEFNSIFYPLFCDPISCPACGDYKFLEFPLDVKFHFGKSEKFFNFYLISGFYAGFMINEKQYEDVNKIYLRYEEKGFRFANLNLNLGLGYNYKLNSNFSIYAEPLFKQFISSHSHWMDKIYIRQYGLRVGLNYHL